MDYSDLNRISREAIAGKVRDHILAWFNPTKWGEETQKNWKIELKKIIDDTDNGVPHFTDNKVVALRSIFDILYKDWKYFICIGKGEGKLANQNLYILNKDKW